MSDLSTNFTIVVALVLGSLRAFGLWRAHTRADAVNVVVLTMLAEKRAGEISALLRHSGSGLYLLVVEQIVQPLEKLAENDERVLRQSLERDAQRALQVAGRRLRRFAWLDALALVAIAYSGISGLLSGLGSWVSSFGLFAATLLWWSNVRAARSLVTQLYAGAMALIDGLVAHSRQAGQEPAVVR